ncbi:MAG: cyclic nucleotide-binding protein, partial [Bacteroidota bacterium]|nr:cyclic nucleotide-binding protein [Bacteroidota bacterium]
MKNRLLQFLNIRSEEAWLVTNLFWLQFFQGFGIAIFNIVALTLFLEHFPLTGLPKAYMVSAVLLWITGYVYSKIEHAVSIKKLVLGVILFIAFTVIAFFIQFSADNESNLVIFLMFCWFYVIYLLGNLEFWGVAALLFDIRQSKRLFGLIGMGDIPGKLIGYSAVTLWIKFISNENLLVVSFISILCSLIFYYRLKKAGKLDIEIKHEHTHATHASESKDKLINFIKSFFGNRMLASVAGLSFIVLTCISIISFSFYAQVEHEAHSNEQLASFIALFYSSGKVIAIIIRLMLTGRLSNVLGVKGSLLVSPILLLVFLIGIIFLPFLTHHNEYFMLCAFGLMMVLTEVLKTSLQDPIFLSLMQPLPSHMRLRGHTLVKGVMDPFALAFSGFMLYGLVKMAGGEVSLYILSYLLLVLVIIWMIMIFVVDREYVKTLVTALNKRYSIGQEIDLDNEQTRHVLEDKIVNGEIGESIYILNLIEKQYTEDKEILVIKALGHKEGAVKMEAIKLAER